MSGRRCSRCDTVFTTDGPARGRRLCDPCRAERASFFDCPGCGAKQETHSATRDELRRPVQCWDCRQGEEAAVRTASIVGHIAGRDPALDRAVIEAAVCQAARSRVERKWLAEHLAAHPDALASQAPSAPRVVCRLAAALTTAGTEGIRPPRCAHCGRPALLVTTTDDGRICATCDGGRRAEPCSRCGRVRRVCHRGSDGGAVCNPCWLRDPATWEVCSGCGRLRRVNARTTTGAAVCPSCYAPPARTCDGCGETRPIVSRSTGRAVCERCYDKPRRRCGGCGRIKVINLRARDGQPDLCNACHWAAVAVCTRCGDEAPGRGVRKGAHVCLRCLAHERIDALLTDDDGTILACLAGLRDAFLATDQPRTIFTWLARSPGAPLLRRLVTGDLALTHDALDRLAQTASLRHVRQLLVATGALPERDPHLARLERFVHDSADSMADADDARLLRSYGTWRVLARLRRRPAPPTESAVKNARHTFSQALAFLRWLHDQGLTLGACDQHHLDRWLADGSAGRRQVRHLLAWAAERNTAAHLDRPRSVARGLPCSPEGDTRWVHARRFLHDDDVDPADRVVGTLVVLYAQPLTRVARLRLDDVAEIDGHIHLNFGKELVFMPEPLGGFLRQLPWRRQIGPSGHVPGADQWLFPGRQAGRHQHPEYLAQRLRAIGVKPRASRSEALLRLGAQLPAKVLADLLNLNVGTAVRWTKAAGGDWTTYAADRIRRPHLEAVR